MKLGALILLALPALADVEVVVDGAARATYLHRGTTYVEAARGRDYTLRLTNPTGERVAVALSVDGLNTIDARHTDGWNASKWVLAPYETVDIAGWQVSDSTARRFVFTGERHSYGAALGQTDNLGVIEAIFYRERRRPIARRYEGAPSSLPPPSAGAAERRSDAAAPQIAAESALDDEYAATGMGGRTQHDITPVHIDLDRTPFATTRIRYEFRPQLIKLGVISAQPTRMERREKAKGFERYCPEP